jgi:Cu-processing system ATP-binding protein
MIQIENIFKKYNQQQVLNNFSIDFKANECIALIGPNGCGKTTLIKSILGMVLPDSGSIKVLGQNIKNNDLYRDQIGYMPQIGRYPENMSIGQIFDMIQDIRKSERTLDKELYDEYKLESILHKNMRTLSGGTTQKVSAALAFLFNPLIYILDEPTAGLDPLASEILKNKMMREKKENKLTLITSHLLTDLDDLITSIVFMQEGNLIFHRSVEDLKNKTGEDKISKAIAKVLKEEVK